RIETGQLTTNTSVKVMNAKGEVIENERITKILGFRGLNRVPLESAEAGDIIAIAGLKKATVADTIAVPSVVAPIAAQPIDPPTLSMTFSINDSPLAGLEGKKLTSRMVADRLFKEAEGNVSIKITQSEDKDSFDVAGRGELQLGVLIETMRREGFELSISRPRVLFQTNEKGQKLEPIEEAVIDVDDEYVGTVVESLSKRKGDLIEMRPSGGGKTRVIFHIPSRGLIGYHGQFLTETRGTGVMNRIFHSYGDYRGEITTHRRGALISTENGDAVAYALWNLEERGTMFISPGDKVYLGMVIGENSRDNDLEVNPLKGKQLTNMRASGKDEAVKLTPPKAMTLEQAISYIQDDERVEVTPKTIRIRKAILCPHERKKASRTKE
ncbi:MAG: EF-Tu/IF-2/RF-3 family GTPase, partial [Alphaproteobacteria bacterium]|nr:EF-Tu/IF-2/RF-3 family GTPase [Alphaproteobacteria bacterium]